MKALLTVKDRNENSEDNYLVETDDPKHLFYRDMDGGMCDLEVQESGLTIKRFSRTHQSVINLNDHPEAIIISREGQLVFDVVVEEHDHNENEVHMVYCIEEQRKEITIRYLGVN